MYHINEMKIIEKTNTSRARLGKNNSKFDLTLPSNISIIKLSRDKCFGEKVVYMIHKREVPN